MQVMGVTGKIYGMKPGQTQNGKDKVSFRVGVRKQFITDQDKQDKKTLTFLPMIAMGPTAKFIQDYFKDGDSIAIGTMEYQTYRTQNAPNEFDDAHIFKVDKVGFCGDNNSSNDSGNSSSQRSNNNSNNGYSNNNNNNNYNNNNNNNQRSNTRQTVPADNGPVDNSYSVTDDDLPF